jgi:hypothetical protein
MRYLRETLQRLQDNQGVMGEMNHAQRENGDGKQQHLMNWVKQRVAEGRDNLLESKEIIAFCHSREVEEAHPIVIAFAVERACEVLKSRQQVRSRRSWRCLSSLGQAALALNDRYTLNLVAHCAEMGEAISAECRMMQVGLMSTASRALPEQELKWSEECAEADSGSAATSVFHAAHIAHHLNDSDAVDEAIYVRERLLDNDVSGKLQYSLEGEVEEMLLVARHAVMKRGCVDLEKLCNLVRDLPEESREKYCREISESFVDCVSPQRCAVCSHRFSGHQIMR